jgi:hypothetical protein
LKTEVQWPIRSQSACQIITDDDPEVKKRVTVCTVETGQCVDNINSTVEKLLKYHSSWYRLKKTVAWILALKDQLLSKLKNTVSRDQRNGLTADELNNAEVQILNYAQQQTFARDIKAVRSKQTVKRTSTVYQHRHQATINSPIKPTVITSLFYSIFDMKSVNS